MISIRVIVTTGFYLPSMIYFIHEARLLEHIPRNMVSKIHPNPSLLLYSVQ